MPCVSNHHQKLDCFLTAFSGWQQRHVLIFLQALCWGNPLASAGFPSQKASNDEILSMSRREHELERQGDYHYSDVIMIAMASQTTSIWIVCSSVCSGADQRKHQSSASLALVMGIHRSSVGSHHKGPVSRKMFLFDDVIMCLQWEGKSMARSALLATS